MLITHFVLNSATEWVTVKSVTKHSNTLRSERNALQFITEGHQT